MEEISVEIARGQEEKIRKIEKGMELARKRIAEAFEKSKKEYPIDSMIKRLMEKKEFAIGEEFQMGLVKLKCVKASVKGHDHCNGCYMFENCLDCHDMREFMGSCYGDFRLDRTDVIFVEVK